MNVVQNAWQTQQRVSNSAHVITAKFKLMRRTLKHWVKNVSNLAKLISNCNITIGFLDKLEESRILLHEESCFRNIIKNNLQTLLHF
jgi:hypothetical protein